MELTCNRCHRSVESEDCYCPACGLPQLVYSAEDGAGPGQPERWTEGPRDASIVMWKPALRVALMLAVPAGLLCSGLSPVGLLGLFWMAAAAAWAVLLYVRNQQAAWITLGAGARIGLVAGILGAWTAAAATGASLFIMRYLLHQGKDIDAFWQAMTIHSSPSVDPQSVAMVNSWLQSSEGRAGMALFCVVVFVSGLIFFAVGGGALGARLTARARRPQV